MLLVGQILNVFSISLLPLSLVTILQNTQAFWTAVMGYLINREAFLAVEAIAIAACFIGVIMIASSTSEHDLESADQILNKEGG